MDETQREALASRLLELAGGQSEAIVSDSDVGLTRFTHNAIHQNLAERNTSVRLRTVVDGRTGVAITNDLDESGLRAVVERAHGIAALAPADPEVAPLAHSARTATPAHAYDKAVAAATPERRAQIAADVFAVAEAGGVWAAGYVTTERAGTTIANSHGTLVSYDGTTCGLNVKANGSDATGYAEFFGSALDGLDPTRIATVAVNKARAGTAPQPVEAGAWTVILEPPAFGELLSYVVEHFSAQAYDEGSSFLSGGLERSYAGDNVTIGDDYAHPLHAGMPFDYEGVPTQRLSLLEQGSAKAVVTDTNWSKRLGRADTGHAEPAPSADGPQARHVVVDAGSASLDSLIAGTKRGLLVSRFWYIRPVDRRRTIVTGMTRDGTFLIENGVVGRGVRNMRFNQSILEALCHAQFADTQARTAGYAYSIVLPAVKIENFHFTSVTDF
ncbi:MAG: TldD/PmbA family protein [Candidatus Eremiobacteraeota bacterium]|nr:TldD/PmbA family protein [Candidatus Eremiobacteraeota bacterium]